MGVTTVKAECHPGEEREAYCWRAENGQMCADCYAEHWPTCPECRELVMEAGE